MFHEIGMVERLNNYIFKMNINELKQAYIEKLPVGLKTYRGEIIKYEKITMLTVREYPDGRRILSAVLADYSGHSFTIADPRQLNIIRG